MPRQIPVVTPTKNPPAPPPPPQTLKQKARTVVTSTPVVLFTVYTAVMVLLAVLSYDDWRDAVAAMSFYFLGAIAFHVSKGAR